MNQIKSELEPLCATVISSIEVPLPADEDLPRLLQEYLRSVGLAEYIPDWAGGSVVLKSAPRKWPILNQVQSEMETGASDSGALRQERLSHGFGRSRDLNSSTKVKAHAPPIPGDDL